VSTDMLWHLTNCRIIIIIIIIIICVYVCHVYCSVYSFFAGLKSYVVNKRTQLLIVKLLALFLCPMFFYICMLCLIFAVA